MRSHEEMQGLVNPDAVERPTIQTLARQFERMQLDVSRILTALDAQNGAAPRPAES